MKLKVTLYGDNGGDWEAEPELKEVDFDDFDHYEFIEGFFIVVKTDGTCQAIRNNKVAKFQTTI